MALFSNDLRLLPALLELARRARRTIGANIVLAVAAKVCRCGYGFETVGLYASCFPGAVVAWMIGH